MIRLLVVDDQEINQIVLVRILNKLGYSATVADNGIDAVEQVGIYEYDLIFMDIDMPFMDGISAAHIILTTASHLPKIIAVTSHSGIEKKCMEVGMMDVILKPITIDKIRTMLNKYLG